MHVKGVSEPNACANAIAIAVLPTVMKYNSNNFVTVHRVQEFVKGN
jgi:hypothetical protein